MIWRAYISGVLLGAAFAGLWLLVPRGFPTWTDARYFLSIVALCCFLAGGMTYPREGRQ